MPSKRRKSKLARDTRAWFYDDCGQSRPEPAQEHVSVSKARVPTGIDAAFERHLLLPLRDSFDSPEGQTQSCPCDELWMKRQELLEIARKVGHPGTVNVLTAVTVEFNRMLQREREMLTLLEDALEEWSEGLNPRHDWTKRVREVLK